MDPVIWVYAVVLVIVVDLAALLVGFATVVDRQLCEADRRWRFALGSLLLAMTLAAFNFGAVAGLLAGR
jgi:hypothetical protein